MNHFSVSAFSLSVFRTVIGSIPAVTALILYLEARRRHNNEKLKRHLRRALRDCLALYEIEHRLAAELEVHRNVSGESIRRYYRAELREEGMEPISKTCNPTDISRQLANL